VSFIGIVPNFFSTNENGLDFLAPIPALKQEISQEEAMKGLLFKGPFIVHHPRYENPLLAVELMIKDKNISFFDGVKLFLYSVEGNVVVKNNQLVLKIMTGNKMQELKIRGLRRSDPLELTGKDMPLNKFAKKMYQEIYA